MKLDECPLCQLQTEDNVGGELCVKGKLPFHVFDPKSIFGNPETLVEVSALKEHTDIPSPEAIMEAMKMLTPATGMIEEVRGIAGHWAMWVMPGNWSGNGKSIVKD